MRMPLGKRLRESGCKFSPERFRELVVDALHNMYRGWNDEDLMHNPEEAAKFCARIRTVNTCESLSDETILRALSGVRKKSDQPKRRRDKSI